MRARVSGKVVERRRGGGGWGFIRCEEHSDRERGGEIYTLQGEKTWDRARE